MVKIRLARHGAKKRPYYRIVVADARCPRDGKFIDDIGRYNPLTEPAMIKIDLEKCDKWLANGAQPTDTVAALIKKFREQAYAYGSADRGNRWARRVRDPSAHR